MTTDLDIEALKAKAEKATGGEWCSTPARSRGYKSPMPDFHEARVHVGPKENFGNSIAIVCMGGSGATSCSAEDVDANAAFIAAANPSAILELIAQRAELLEALQLTRMSRGWQYMSDEAKAVIDQAISRTTQSTGEES